MPPVEGQQVCIFQLDWFGNPLDNRSFARDEEKTWPTGRAKYRALGGLVGRLVARVRCGHYGRPSGRKDSVVRLPGIWCLAKDMGEPDSREAPGRVSGNIPGAFCVP